jgi:hypothetical protein
MTYSYTTPKHALSLPGSHLPTYPQVHLGQATNQGTTHLFVGCKECKYGLGGLPFPSCAACVRCQNLLLQSHQEVQQEQGTGGRGTTRATGRWLHEQKRQADRQAGRGSSSSSGSEDNCQSVKAVSLRAGMPTGRRPMFETSLKPGHMKIKGYLMVQWLSGCAACFYKKVAAHMKQAYGKGCISNAE